MITRRSAIGCTAAMFLTSPGILRAHTSEPFVLADVFGFVGTPGLVVGHMDIEGAVPVSLLRRVVADGLSSALPAC